MQVYGYLLDWDKALKLKAEGKLLESEIEDYGEVFGGVGEEDDEEDEDDDDQEDDGGGWPSDSAMQYQFVGGAYAQLRQDLSPATRAATDAVMDLFTWDGQSSCHRLRDLGEGICPNLHFLTLGPESVRRILREAEKMDFAEFKAAYEKHVPEEEQEEFAPYDLNVENYIRDQWLGSLRKAAERGMGFGVYAG